MQIESQRMENESRLFQKFPLNQLTKRGTRRDATLGAERFQFTGSAKRAGSLLLKFKIQEVSKYLPGARAVPNFLANLIKVLDRGNCRFLKNFPIQNSELWSDRTATNKTARI